MCCLRNSSEISAFFCHTRFLSFSSPSLSPSSPEKLTLLLRRPRCSTESHFSRSEMMVWRLTMERESEPDRVTSALPMSTHLEFLCVSTHSLVLAPPSFPSTQSFGLGQPPQTPPSVTVLLTVSAPTGGLRPPHVLIGPSFGWSCSLWACISSLICSRWRRELE